MMGFPVLGNGPVVLGENDGVYLAPTDFNGTFEMYLEPNNVT